MPKLETLWATIVTTYSPSTIEFTGTLLVQILAFWIPSLVYLALPSLLPAWSTRHKIQPAPKQPTKKEIQYCVQVVLRNQLLTSALHIVQLKLLQGNTSSYTLTSTFPALPIIARDFVLSLLAREALFYYAHRFLHRPYFYVRIHKQHHKFTAPISLAAQFAHPIEQIFANALPISLPPQLLGSHVLTFWVFLAYELFVTATVHSGFDFFGGKAKMHDLHHEKFNLNYGSIGLLDWVHGTDRLEKKKE
ncbi:fatty acid hydroxylase superfamily-domain-containing protein [Aspergillus bertholletiae]|uniref:Fatty acid hydroxylase superfamily-domain-containing protein n=1 Tax=Aspergillus bertholletiae TaxID=1226010 RepID=A0A5N7BDV8_9EURO|nr:fatty acid hydroxylase superfamily-domain-containing protein [Aspergillus bertholletiae]